MLKDGGILILDAPNTAFLGSDDIVEEWFIDKHLYHFSARTLTRMIEAAGFDDRRAARSRATAAICSSSRARTAAGRRIGRERPQEVDTRRDLIATYIATRARNLMALTAVAAEIARLAPRGVAMWGAGRLFDSLVVHGHFDPRALTLLIDKHLKPLVGERHGCALAGPEALAEADAGVVVVMSRDFAQRNRGRGQHARRRMPKSFSTAIF